MIKLIFYMCRQYRPFLDIFRILGATAIQKPIEALNTFETILSESQAGDWILSNPKDTFQALKCREMHFGLLDIRKFWICVQQSRR